MQPTARAVNLWADEARQDEENQTRDIHRERTPADPAVIDQAGDDEGPQTDRDPVRLLAPELGREGIPTQVGGAVDREDPKDGERRQVGGGEPVKAQEFAK